MVVPALRQAVEEARLARRAEVALGEGVLGERHQFGTVGPRPRGVLLGRKDRHAEPPGDLGEEERLRDDRVPAV